MASSTPWRQLCYDKTRGQLRQLALSEADRLRVQEALANAYADGYNHAMNKATRVYTRRGYRGPEARED